MSYDVYKSGKMRLFLSILGPLLLSSFLVAAQDCESNDVNTLTSVFFPSSTVMGGSLDWAQI